MATRTIVRLADQAAGFLTNASASTTYQPKVANVSNEEIGYLDGVTSGIQSQINSKLSASSASTTYAPIVPTTQTGFRNLLINGDFRINQRAAASAGSGGTPAYLFDRWFILSHAANSSITPQTFTLGNAILGYEPINFLRLTGHETTKADAYDVIGQRIEDVRNFAGQQVTISFWAKVASGTPNISIELNQNFGSGGSPSAEVNTYVDKIALSTSWTRYTETITVPSISGKTIGTTANTSYLELRIWCQAGSDFNARTNSLGNQNNTFDFWGFQIERGNAATPFEQRPIGTELALCQRYYEKSYNQNTAPGTITESGAFYAWTSTQADGFAGSVINFKIPKRSSTYTFTGYSTSTGASGNFNQLRAGVVSVVAITGNLGQGESSISPYIQSGANNSLTRVYGQWTVNAEL